MTSVTPTAKTKTLGIVEHPCTLPPMTNTHLDVPCTCNPDQYPGTYATGCKRHIAIELDRGTTARPRTQSHTVTYYHAEVTISTPVLHDGTVWSQQDHVRCEHNHTTLEAADACGRRIARGVQS